MKEINISNATDLPKEFFDCLQVWQEEASRILNDNEIKWFAKLTSTTFRYGEKYYIVSPQDVFSENTLKNCPINFLCAGFEILQHKITSDLNALGAKNIRNWGFLD